MMGEPLMNRALEERFSRGLGDEVGSKVAHELIAVYSTSVTRLRNDVWPGIAAREPNLTKHDESHIEAVLRNVEVVVDGSELSALDIYVVCMMVLFHDVGNLEGRTEHNQKVAEIYDDIHPQDVSDSALRSAVLAGCRAHCGFAVDGSRDTLSAIGDFPLCYKQVRVQQLAAILRFCDEMSEDPRRTSRYMLNHHKYAVDSEIHHWYATVTAPCIDLGNGRVVLRYNLHVPPCEDPQRETFFEILPARLAYLVSRIEKLDRERRYNGYFSTSIGRLNRTEFSIYMDDGNTCVPCQERPFILSNLVTPDAPEESIVARWPELESRRLAVTLLEALNDQSEKSV